MTSVEIILQAMAGAIGFVFCVIFYFKYQEGRKALTKLNSQTDEAKQNEMEKGIYKKYNDMSLDDLSNSSGRESGDKS